jgi:predicted porin
MKTLLIAGFALASVAIPAAAGAQGAPTQADLARLVSEQMQRIEALEARLAEMQQEMRALGAQARGGQQPVPLEPPLSPTVEAEVDQIERDYPHAVGGAVPEDVATAMSPAADLPEAAKIGAYGSLRVATAWDFDGNHEIRNNASRLGIRGEKAIFDWLTGFARLELGVNLVANDRVIITGGDPGVPIGQGSQAITSRLGFVGFGTPVGTFAWGKQWSSYYDVAEFTDQFPLFSGAATGAFAAGTDGGLAGTGRAERALQYRGAYQRVSGAIQTQSRATSLNDRTFADAWGTSGMVDAGGGFSVAAAYNEVRDGVEDPGPNESKLGDKAAIFGVRFRNDRWYAASTYSILKQHEIDDLGRRFDGNGFELAVRHSFDNGVSLDAGYNDLSPDSDHPGQYRVRFGTANFIYNFSTASRIFFSFRLDGSRRVDGSDLSHHAIGTGFNYTF